MNQVANLLVSFALIRRDFRFFYPDVSSAFAAQLNAIFTRLFSLARGALISFLSGSTVPRKSKRLSSSRRNRSLITWNSRNSSEAVEFLFFLFCFACFGIRLYETKLPAATQNFWRDSEIGSLSCVCVISVLGINEKGQIGFEIVAEFGSEEAFQ